MSHVLLIVVDALRADHVGCYRDSGESRTPSIDGLAREGVRFSNAISQASWTRASVTSLMTGLYPTQHGLVDRVKQRRAGGASIGALDPSIPTLAEILSAGGFATAAFLAGNANLKPAFGTTRGFDHLVWHPTADGSVLAEELAHWLREGRLERTFSYVHLMDVHHPLPAEIIPSRLDRGIDLSLVAETTEELVGHYGESVREADGHAGRLVRAIDAAGMLDDTMIVLTADHGEELGEHGAMLAHGRTLYRELVRVPLIVKLPRGAHAGETIDGPVQLIDLAPTILEHLGRPPLDLPGRSLLRMLRSGAEEGPSGAFSELHRADRYSQSVTTRTHQLVLTFRFEDLADGSPTDLSPGLNVSVKGEPIKGGPLLATKVSLKSASTPKVRGTITKTDDATGSVTVFGLDLQVDGDTVYTGLDGEPFGFADLRVGDKISAAFTPASGGRHTARKITRRKVGGKSKIEGTIERLERLEGGACTIQVLGTDVLVGENTRVTPLREKGRAKRAQVEALSRVLAGDFLAVEWELYDFTDDPLEARNIVDERPDLAQELETLLADWTRSLGTGAPMDAGTVDVDPETMEQLRLMGYVE